VLTQTASLDNSWTVRTAPGPGSRFGFGKGFAGAHGQASIGSSLHIMHSGHEEAGKVSVQNPWGSVPRKARSRPSGRPQTGNTRRVGG